MAINWIDANERKPSGEGFYLTLVFKPSCEEKDIPAVYWWNESVSKFSFRDNEITHWAEYNLPWVTLK